MSSEAPTSPPPVPLVNVADLKGFVGRVVKVRGWLYNRRSSKLLHFLEVRDGTGIAQCVVFAKEVADQLFETAGHLPQESSLELTGEVREHPKRRGDFEIG